MMNKNSIKKLTLYTCLIFSSVAFLSCENNEVATPTACFEMLDGSGNQISQVKVGEPVNIRICDHNPELLAVWTGDILYTPLKTKDGKKDSVDAGGNKVMVVKERHVYADYGQAFPGEPINRTQGAIITKDATTKKYPDYSYKYTQPGTYTVSVVATNPGINAENLKANVAEKQIIVIK